MNDLQLSRGHNLTVPEGPLTRDCIISATERLIIDNRAARKISMGPYLIALPAEARGYLRVPPSTRVVELASFDFVYYDLTIDGVIGLHFSDYLRGRQVGLIDLNNFVTVK